MPPCWPKVPSLCAIKRDTLSHSAPVSSPSDAQQKTEPAKLGNASTPLADKAAELLEVTRSYIDEIRERSGEFEQLRQLPQDLAERMARVWLGVVPQHPPIMRTPAHNRRRAYCAMYSGEQR